MKSLTLLVFVAALGVACGGPASGAAPPDLVLQNASVYTLDAGRSWAQAVAIRDGRIVAVGSDDEVGRFIANIWSGRIDRYSADRLAALNSSNYDPKNHKKIEMISLGG